MKKLLRLTKLLLTAALFGMGQSAWAQQTPVQNGVYYLYNTGCSNGSSGFLSRGGNWGTYGIISPLGYPIKLISTGETDTYYFQAYDNTSAYLADDGFMWTDGNESRRRAIKLISKGDGNYVLQNTSNTSENNYIENWYGNPVGDAPENRLNYLWQFLSPTEYETKVAGYTTSELISIAYNAGWTLNSQTDAGFKEYVDNNYTAVDKTSLITTPTFDTSHSTDGWTITGITSDNNHARSLDLGLGWGNESTKNTPEAYERCGTISQTVTVDKAGLYKVSVNAFMRGGNYASVHEAGACSSLAYLQANDNKVRIGDIYNTIESGGAIPNAPTDANNTYFKNGKYLNEVFVYVPEKNKTITITINNPSYTPGSWLVFNNFKLTYYEGTYGKYVGDEYTVADIDFSSAISESTVAGTVNSMTFSNVTGDNKFELGYTSENQAATVLGDVLRVGNGTGTVTIPDNELAGTRDEVVIIFDMWMGNLSGKKAGFYLYDANNNVIGALYFCPYDRNSVDANTFGFNVSGSFIPGVGSSSSQNSNICVDNNKSTFELHLNYANGTMYAKQYLNDVLKQTTSSIAMGSTSPLKKFVVKSEYNNKDRRCWFDNLHINTVVGDYSVQSANYSVKWKCGDDVVKEETRIGDVNTAISLVPADTQPFSMNDGANRYIYVSDDAEGKTVTIDGETVITVTVREAVKYNYTVTSSYSGNTLNWTTSGSVWEDLNSVTVQYPRFQACGTTLVEKAPSNNSLRTTFTVTKDGHTQDIKYSLYNNITNLYLLSEAENLSGTGLSTSSTSFTNRVSNSQIAYGSSGNLLTLPAGSYIFTLGVIGGSSNQKVNYVVYKEGKDVDPHTDANKIAEGTCTGNTMMLISSSEFTLTEETMISFTSSNSDASRGVDLVYVQKLGERVNVGKNGYATFASPYALDLTDANRPAGLKAYKATLSETTLSFEKLNQTVPAGTGLLLLGEDTENPYEIKVVSSGTDVEDNALVGVTSPTSKQSSGSGNYYFVMKKADAASDPLTFAPLSTSAVTIPAGKAYVEVPASAFPTPSRSLAISFIDDVTGINTVDAAENHAEGIYNLNGQRVVAPSKGLYIMNGKKVIMK